MITLLAAECVPVGAGDVVFRHSEWRATVAAVMVLATGSVCLWKGLTGSPAILYYLAAVCGAGLLVLQQLVLARFRASNWLARTSDRGVFVHFRSYLNFRLPPSDQTVVFIPYEDIRRARRVTEQTEIPYRDSDDTRITRSTVSTLTWVELEVLGDTHQLRQALDAELARRPLSGALYRDYPVRLTSGDTIQLRWTVVPDVERLLDILSDRVPVGAAASTNRDFTALQRLPEPERRQRLVELIQSGDTVTAIAWCRRLYGLDLTAARAFVERLNEGDTRCSKDGSATSSRR